jgi:hypothetical protein
VESGSLAVNIARTASLEGEKQVNDRFEVRIEQCRNLPVPALRAKYEKVFGETPRSRNKDYLFRGLPGACRRITMVISLTKRANAL